MQTIEITDIGPVKHVSIPVPEEGGIVILRARNGRGKTKTLEAVESAITGRGKIDVRDGSLRGEVEAFGVAIKVGRSTRRTGELEVTSLDGRLSVAELVDPGLKSDEAADAKRVKALVQLTGVKPAADLFYPLIGDRSDFEKLVGTNALESDDLVVMADRIKRDLESAARKEESQVEHAEGRARGCREAAAGIDVNAESDAAKLQSDLESAIQLESRLRAELSAFEKASKAAKLASDQLEDAEASYGGPPLVDAKDKEAKAKQRQEDTTRAVREAEEALARAQSADGHARLEYSQAIQSRKTAEQHEAMVKQWRDQIAAAIPAKPSEDHIARASKMVLSTRQAVEAGALIRKARLDLMAADQHAETAKEHAAKAAKLREAAKGTDEVLSSVVAKTGCPLRVEAGRLVLDTKRGATYFAELSHGERWKMALDIAIDAVGPKGVLTIPQEAFESLDPTNRRLIADHVRGTGVVILTAEASDDEELTAELFEPEGAAAV